MIKHRDRAYRQDEQIDESYEVDSFRSAWRNEHHVDGMQRNAYDSHLDIKWTKVDDGVIERCEHKRWR